MKVQTLSLSLLDWLPESVRFEQVAAVQIAKVAAHFTALEKLPTTAADWQDLWKNAYGLSTNFIPIDGLGLLSHVVWQERHVFLAEPEADYSKALRKYLQQQDITDYTLLHSVSADELTLHRIVQQPELRSEQTTKLFLKNIQNIDNEEDSVFYQRILPVIQSLAPRVLWQHEGAITGFWADCNHLFGLQNNVHRYSLLGQTRFTLQQETMPRDYAKISAAYGDSSEARSEGTAQWLASVWLGRLWFLKQIETQLLRYHTHDAARNRFRFLRPDWSVTVTENGTKKTLISDSFAFWAAFIQEVLHTPTAERKAAWQTHFAAIPYLNAGIFGLTAIEEKTILMASLSDEKGLEICANGLIFKDLAKGLAPDFEFKIATTVFEKNKKNDSDLENSDFENDNADEDETDTDFENENPYFKNTDFEEKESDENTDFEYADFPNDDFDEVHFETETEYLAYQKQILEAKNNAKPNFKTTKKEILYKNTSSEPPKSAFLSPENDDFEPALAAEKDTPYYTAEKNETAEKITTSENIAISEKINFITYFLRLCAKLDFTEIPQTVDWLNTSAAYQLPPYVLTEWIERWSAASGGTYLSAAYANDLYHSFTHEMPAFLPNIGSGRLLQTTLLHQLSQTNLVLRSNLQRKQPPHYWLENDKISIVLKDGTTMQYAIATKNGLRKLPNCQSVQEAVFDAFHLIIQEKLTYSNELPHLNWLTMWHIYGFGLQFVVYKQGNNTQLEPFGNLNFPAQNGNMLYDRRLTDDEILQNSRTQQKIQKLKKIHYQTFGTPTLLPTHHSEREETRLLEEIKNLQNSLLQLPEQLPIPIVFFPKPPYHLVVQPPSGTPVFAQSTPFLQAVYQDSSTEGKYVEHLIGRKEVGTATFILPSEHFKPQKIAIFQRLAAANSKQLFCRNDVNSNKILFLELIEKSYEKSL
jgi:hypothetical protein